MPDTDHLIRLTFSTIRGAVGAEGPCVTDFLQAFPERNGDAAVVRVAESASQLSFFNQFCVLTTELKFIAKVINRPRSVGLHQHAALDGADDFIQARLAWLQVDIGHAVDGWTVPGARPCVRNSRE